MSGSVEVVTSELQLAADRLRASGQRLQDGLSAVDLETGNLLGSGWKGEAATAFAKYWDQWHTGAGQVVRALQTMSDALDEAARGYTAQDEQASGALDTTMGGGSGSGSGAAGAGGGSPSGAAAPTGGGSAAQDGGPGAQTGGAGAPGGGPTNLADSMNLGQALQPLSQLGAIPAQMAGQLTAGMVQAGQLAAGAAQQAVQAGIQQAEAAEAAEQAQQDSEKPEESTEDDKPPSEAPQEAAAAEPGVAAPVDPPREGPGTSGPESAAGRRL